MEEWRGMPVVNGILEEAQKRMDVLKDKGIVPTLAVVRVGEREDDLSYERGIRKRFDAVGAQVVSKVLPVDVTQSELEKTVKECDADPAIHGILLFRPLPKGLDEKAVTALVSPMKDVDCMNIYNIAHTFMQDGEGHEPCTPEAVIRLLDHYGYDLTGKKAVVVGRSMVVGKPLAMMLLKRNATVTVCHTRTKDMDKILKDADLICAAAGSPKMIGREFMGKGQTLIDVGVNVVDGALTGDVDYEAAKECAAYATPVPGGVGAVTTSCLLLHTIRSAETA